MENPVAVHVGQLWEEIDPGFINEIRIPGITIDGWA